MENSQLIIFFKEGLFGAFFGILAIILTGSLTLISYFLIGLTTFLFLLPIILAIQILYYLLYSFWTLWFGFSPSYQALKQRISRKRVQKEDPATLTRKGFRYMVSGIVMMILFQPTLYIVFNLL